MKFVRAPRHVLPRRENGVDHEANRICLIRHYEGKDLIWRMGGKTWADRIAGYITMPAELKIYDRKSVCGETLHEGGRLGQPLLQRPTVMDRIIKVFGSEAHARLTKMNLQAETLYIEQ